MSPSSSDAKSVGGEPRTLSVPARQSSGDHRNREDEERKRHPLIAKKAARTPAAKATLVDILLFAVTSPYRGC